MSFRIYHNSRCSKSVAALQCLQGHTDAIDIIDYLDAPPSVEALHTIHSALQCDVRELLRFNESTALELGLFPSDQRSDEQWMALIAEHPILLQRPIVLSNGRGVIARPCIDTPHGVH